MMKKIIVTFLMIISVGVFGQNASQENKIKYFVDAATKEFSLSRKQSRQLLAARNKYIEDYMGVMGKVKNGVISQDEKASKINDVNVEFNESFAKISGKSLTELQPFFRSMSEELKNVKSY
ncbi:hypothetical protein [Flavobacterium sp.]|uniref:hypothetical protein n=1 Tax=Flavobacterium sp. TaxID=239 RepID=UPI003C5CE2BF